MIVIDPYLQEEKMSKTLSLLVFAVLWGLGVTLLCSLLMNLVHENLNYGCVFGVAAAAYYFGRTYPHFTLKSKNRL